jgi:hypothetical protein
MEGNRIPKRVLYMNLESTRPRGRPRNRWQDEVTEDGRIVGSRKTVSQLKKTLILSYAHLRYA